MPQPIKEDNGHVRGKGTVTTTQTRQPERHPLHMPDSRGPIPEKMPCSSVCRAELCDEVFCEILMVSCMIRFMAVSEDLMSALGASVTSNSRPLLAWLTCHIEVLPVSSPSTSQALIQWPPIAKPLYPEMKIMRLQRHSQSTRPETMDVAGRGTAAMGRD
ncbi:hypothetical protein BDW66DRAFT_15624 [Aspergillus desertorum]